MHPTGFHRLVFVLCALSLPLTACSTIKSFDKAANLDIHKIALANCPDPVSFAVLDTSTPLVLLQPKTVVATPVDVSTDGGRLTQNLTAAGLHAGLVLTDTVEKQLRAEGYEVVRVDISQQDPRALADSVAAMNIGADAVLKIDMLQIGYMTTLFNDYHPLLKLSARLIKIPSHEIAFAWPEVAIGMRPDPFMKPYMFKSLDDLLTDTPRAAEGMQRTLTVVGEGLALQLQR